MIGTALPIVNPTAVAPIRRELVCTQRPKALVSFDVTLMEPAEQGFFDVAVAFDAFFCSASLACCDDADHDGACAADGSEDRKLLYDASGERGSSLIVDFACTASADLVGEVELYLDDLTLDCTDPAADAFDPDLTLSPSAGGTLCTVGEDGMSACPQVHEAHGLDADDYLFQFGVFEGVEDIGTGADRNQRVYWNLALGMRRPAIAGCRLRLRGTADDTAATPQVTDGLVFPTALYPYLAWDAPLASCTTEALTFDDPAAMVRAAYTSSLTGGFANGYGPSHPLAPFDRGPTCETETCD